MTPEGTYIGQMWTILEHICLQKLHGFSIALMDHVIWGLGKNRGHGGDVAGRETHRFVGPLTQFLPPQIPFTIFIIMLHCFKYILIFVNN
jgi:hypothetical protein